MHNYVWYVHAGRSHVLTLIAAAVGKLDPNNLIHTSCRVFQNVSALFISGLYISIISKPAENTVGDDCKIEKLYCN